MTQSDTITLTPHQLREIAQEGTFYAPWFEAFANLQEAIDLNQDDASEGISMLEQVDKLEARVLEALAQLRDAARRIGPEGF